MSDGQLHLFDLEAGRRRKEAGRIQVELNNKPAVEAMREFARAYAAEHGVVSIDIVRRWASARRLEIKSPNAFGTVFKGRGWRRVGFRPNPVPSAHARMVAVWKLAAADSGDERNG